MRLIMYNNGISTAVNTYATSGLALRVDVAISLIADGRIVSDGVRISAGCQLGVGVGVGGVDLGIDECAAWSS